MTIETLLKLSGLALLLSGILATIGFSLHPHDAGSDHTLWLVAHVVVMSGGVLNLLGLVGLYLRSATRLGLTGLIAFLLATISLVLYLGSRRARCRVSDAHAAMLALAVFTV